MMYLYIFKDGEVKHARFKPCEDDLENVDNGFLDIIDITNPENPLDYYDGEWHVLESAD